MQELVLLSIDIWEKGNEEEYIEKLAKKIGLKPKAMSKRFQERIAPLSDEQLADKQFKFLLVISEVIKEIHKIAVNGIIKELKKEFNTKDRIKTDAILQALSEQNDLDFSLLLNLAVLRKYAKIVEEPIPSKIISKYYQKIKSKIKTKIE
jgi:hypothetical protein